MRRCESAHRAAPRDEEEDIRFSGTWGVQDAEQLFQVVLHQAVEEHLVLVSQRCEEGVFQNDRGLLLLQHSYDTCYHSLQSPALCVIHLHPPDHIRGTWTHLQELIPSSLTLPLQTMHIVRQEPFQSKDLPLLPVEPGSLVQARVVEQRRTWTSGQAPAPVPISRSGR